MAEPDLFQTLPDGTRVLTVVQDLHISRHGNKPVADPDGEARGKWCMAIGWAHYRVNDAGKVQLQNNGQPQVHSFGGTRVDLADVWQLPAARLAYSIVREVAYRHARAGAVGLAEPMVDQINVGDGLVDFAIPPVTAPAPAAKRGLWGGIWRWLRG